MRPVLISIFIYVAYTVAIVALQTIPPVLVRQLHEKSNGEAPSDEARIESCA